MNLVDMTTNANMFSRPRTRKLSLDHHSNSVLMDANGNTRQFKRLSSLSEISIEDAGDDVSDNTDVPKETESDSKSPGLDNNMLHQIHSLIKNVQISESLADYINKEVLGSGSDVNANVGQRTRRRSCFSLSRDPALGNISEYTGAVTRRQSVTSKASSLPRRKASNAGLGLQNELSLPRNGLAQSKGRRNSVVNSNSGTSGRRNSTVSAPRSRRNSVNQLNHLTPLQNGGRRNSVANMCMTRRVSLAHAYQHSAMPSMRRKSCMHDSFVSAQFGALPQRRLSSVKAPCFPVTKIASVQKRLNKIYQRRRRNERNERAQVNIRDVKSAFKNIRKEANNGISDSGASDDNLDNNGVDENSNVCDESWTQASDNENIADVSNVNNDITMNGDTGGDEDTYEPMTGEIPAPRRKTSIQVRAWELSRKLRQRRREKRKGYAESDLI